MAKFMEMKHKKLRKNGKKKNFKVIEEAEKLSEMGKDVAKKPMEKRKRKWENGRDFGFGNAVQTSVEDSAVRFEGESKKKKLSKKNKGKDTEKNKINFDNLDSIKYSISDEQDVGQTDCDTREEDTAVGTGTKILRRSKKQGKRKKKQKCLPEEGSLVEKRGENDQEDVCAISSGDEDCSKGMKKWIVEYNQSRPGLKILQERIDNFITAHEARLEQERKEREALSAEGGWTVVKHHKGRKRTTDTETGIVVGSVSQAALEDKMAKKKRKEVGLDFYRFQKKEAHRNDILALQSKFEQDKKRIQQLRAARKFRPY